MEFVMPTPEKTKKQQQQKTKQTKENKTSKNKKKTKNTYYIFTDYFRKLIIISDSVFCQLITITSEGLKR